MGTETLINSVLGLTARGEEVCLYFFPAADGASAMWRVGAVNPSQHVLIGEVSAKYEADGATLEDALRGLISALSNGEPS